MGQKANGAPGRLGELARLQEGMVSRRQALASGVSPDKIRWAFRTGAWQQVYPGVYATFTGPVGRPARLWAALLYSGEGAVLSHETAAELLELTGQRSALIQVTISSARRVAPPGV